LDYLEEQPYGNTQYNCPLKPKDKFKLGLLFFYAFFVVVLLFNFARKCCP
jgi:hypothetical protein